MVSLPIPLPLNSTLLIQVGDKVTPGQPLAQRPIHSDHNIQLSTCLRVPIKKVATLLQVQPGDAVQIGDIIAVKRNALNFVSAKLKSNIAGTVLGYDEETGILTIGNPHQQEPVLICPIAGTVTVCNNVQIVIETDDNIVQGIGGIGSTTQGQLFILPSVYQPEADQQQFIFQINSSIVDKVILGKSFGRDALAKAISIGTSGIIATQINPEDLAYLEEKNLEVPVVLIQEEQLMHLIHHANKMIYLDATTFTILLLHI